MPQVVVGVETLALLLLEVEQVAVAQLVRMVKAEAALEVILVWADMVVATFLAVFHLLVLAAVAAVADTAQLIKAAELGVA